jgi:tape measure domain-containing protein
MAMGFAGKDIIPTLTNVGDAVAALGSGQAGIENITYALGQMNTSGKVHTQDMMQLTNAGVAAWQMLADKLHVTVAQAQDEVQKGTVSSQVGLDAIMAGMHSRYGGLMSKQSQTVTGLFSNLQDIATQSLAVIGDKLIKTFDVKGGLSKLTGMVTGMSDAFAKLDLKKLAPAAAILGGVIAGILVPAFAALAIAVGGAAIAAAPFILIGAAIGGLAYLLYTNWDKVSAALKPLTDAIFPKLNELWVALQPSIKQVKTELGPIGEIFGRAFKEWEPILKWVGDKIQGFLGGAFGKFIDFLKWAIPNAVNQALFAIKAIGYVIDAVAAAIHGDWGRALEDLKSIAGIHLTVPQPDAPPSGSPGAGPGGNGGSGNATITEFDTGGLFSNAKIIKVGERRPEMVGALDDVFPMMVKAFATAGPANGQTFHINVDGSGGNADEIAGKVREAVRAELAKQRRMGY